MESLLSNLVKNAIEASPIGEEIHICLYDLDPQVISMINKGTVPPRIRDMFFERHITEGKKQGTGLGTYTAKLIANVMNYKINMETSDENNTTCINLFIPRN